MMGRRVVLMSWDGTLAQNIPLLETSKSWGTIFKTSRFASLSSCSCKWDWFGEDRILLQDQQRGWHIHRNIQLIPRKDLIFNNISNIYMLIRSWSKWLTDWHTADSQVPWGTEAVMLRAHHSFFAAERTVLAMADKLTATKDSALLRPHVVIPGNVTLEWKGDNKTCSLTYSFRRHGTTIHYFLMYLWGYSSNEAAPKSKGYFFNSSWPQLYTLSEYIFDCNSKHSTSIHQKMLLPKEMQLIKWVWKKNASLQKIRVGRESWYKLLIQIDHTTFRSGSVKRIHSPAEVLKCLNNKIKSKNGNSLGQSCRFIIILNCFCCSPWACQDIW